MTAIIFRSNDTDAIDRMVETFVVRPLLKNGVRIGNVLRVWREGYALMAEIECVASDVEPEPPMRLTIGRCP